MDAEKLTLADGIKAGEELLKRYNTRHGTSIISVHDTFFQQWAFNELLLITARQMKYPES